MKLFVDTGSIKDIEALAALGILDGVTTNPSLLAKEDTYCHDSLTRVERDWLREHRAPEARKWNMLSDLGVERLSHATSDSVPEPGAPSCKNWTRLLGRKSAWYDGWVCYHAALRVF